MKAKRHSGFTLDGVNFDILLNMEWGGGDVEMEERVGDDFDWLTWERRGE